MIGWIRRVIDLIVREREEWLRTVRVVRLGLRGLIQSQIPRMAAALAYRTIFSLIPVLVVGAAVMGQFLADDELETQISRLIEYIGLDTIALDDGDAAGAAVETAAGEGVPAVVLEGDGGVIALPMGESAARLDEWITSLVERVTNLPFSQIGFIGLLVLVYGAIAMLVELERSLNQIYGASNGRAWTKRITTYWTTLTLGLVFLLATFSVGDRVGDLVASIGKGVGESQGWFTANVVDFAVSVVINSVLLLFAYMTIPNAKVHFRPALAGAAIAGLGWEVGKSGFTAYVANAVDNLQQLYGVLALLPLFLFWVYITWVIVLFGLQVSYALQHFSSWSEEQTAEEVGLVDPSVAVRFAALLAGAFDRGDALRVSDLSEETGAPAQAAGHLLSGMVKSGVARRVDLDGDEDGYVLARPAGTVAVCELLDIGRRLRAGGERGGESGVDGRARAAVDGLMLDAVLVDGVGVQAGVGSPDTGRSGGGAGG